MLACGCDAENAEPKAGPLVLPPKAEAEGAGAETPKEGVAEFPNPEEEVEDPNAEEPDGFGTDPKVDVDLFTALEELDPKADGFWPVWPKVIGACDWEKEELG